MIARRADNAPASRSSADCMLGSKSSAESKRRGSTPKRGKSQSIFLHRVALVFKQHHDHRNAQQHLRDRAENVAHAANHFHPGIAGLNGSHQYCPQRQRNRQQFEGG